MPLSPETRERLTLSIAQLVRTGRQISSRAATQMHDDLPSFGWPLLLPLERDGDLRCSALALRAGVDASVASRQVATLERAGYLQRRPDPLDGRASLLHITPRGLEALTASRALRSEWTGTALAGWDDDDAVRLADLVDRLLADVEAAAQTAEPTRQGVAG
ncbi:MarR family winged helix-turn-helix transcriptional regulator [Blastococcus sp. LR1]|uniref:MarR family winged helix-turn-helix transcriptional regulator n=1 Tax=Blastococcus sp. LR1 TaxID=2877000 RepID=UPI001CCBC08B|nr:MarR family transcriptional regulator [Blastococcus sp. LR1]MCA0145821.1 MarR family transcriptional regulator [Blastococcus sp. LR1]